MINPDCLFSRPTTLRPLDKKDATVMSLQIYFFCNLTGFRQLANTPTDYSLIWLEEHRLFFTLLS